MFTVDVTEIYKILGGKRMSLGKFAKELGISRNTLRSYLADPSNIPYEILQKIAIVLELDEERARAILFAKKLA